MKNNKLKITILIILMIIVVILTIYILNNKNNTINNIKVDQKEETTKEINYIEEANKSFLNNQLQINESCLYVEEINDLCMIYEDSNIAIKRENNNLYINGKIFIENFKGCNSKENNCKENFGIQKVGDYYNFRFLSENIKNGFILGKEKEYLSDDIIRSINPDLNNYYYNLIFSSNKESILVETNIAIGKEVSSCDDYNSLKDTANKIGFINALYEVEFNSKTGKIGKNKLLEKYTFDDLKESLNNKENILKIQEDGTCIDNNISEETEVN